MPELHRRTAAITARHNDLTADRGTLAAQRTELARCDQLRHGIEYSAARIRVIIDDLDPAQKQQLHPAAHQQLPVPFCNPRN